MYAAEHLLSELVLFANHLKDCTYGIIVVVVRRSLAITYVVRQLGVRGPNVPRDNGIAGCE